MLVADARSLSARLFDQIDELQRSGIVVGVIAARSPSALKTSVTLRAVAASLATAGHFRTSVFRWVDIAPLIDVDVLQGTGRVLLGASATGEMIAAGLGIGASVLRIASHGDGVDVFLGSAGCLCAVKALKSRPAALAPMCVVRSYCHRLRTSLDEAIATPKTIAASSLISRALVLDSCASFPTRFHPIHRRWQLVEQLATHPGVGAVLGTPDLTFGSTFDLDPLLQDIANGMQMAKVLSKFSGSDAARILGRRLFLNGDPSFSAAKPNDVAAPVLRNSCSEMPSLSTALGGDLASLRALIESGPNPATAEAMVASIARRGWVRWLEIVSRAATSRSWENGTTSCARCGGVNRHLRATGDLVGDRCVASCSGCGVRDDRPWKRAQFPASFLSSNDGAFSVSGIRPQGNWSAILAIWAYDKGDLVTFSWPPDAKGKPVSSLSVGAGIPPGPRRAGFIIVDEVSWELLTTPHYQSMQSERLY